MHRHFCLVAVAAVVLQEPLPAQSLLYRSPNLSGTWTGDAGVVHFNFLHRFYVASSDGSHKVTNYPTFTLAVGPVNRVLAGLRYASNSSLVPLSVAYRPNEIEVFARWRPVGVEGANGLSVAVTPAYNAAARSVDGEVAADYTAGRVTVSGAARAIGKPFGIDTADARLAIAGGVSLRLNRYVAIEGDVAQMLDADTTLAWSTGIGFLIPGSPHTFSLHASKSTSTTLQGASISGSPKVVYGFEFTIPLHLSRFAPWFGGGARAADTGGDAAATVRIAQLKFQVDTVTIAAGQSVRWVNDDEVVHTVTFAGDPPSSGNLARGQTFVARFDRPGTYAYTCTPHPAMRGVVVVK